MTVDAVAVGLFLVAVVVIGSVGIALGILLSPTVQRWVDRDEDSSDGRD